MFLLCSLLFLCRYALATLFFSTGGSDHWKFQTNFLSGWHECSWFDVFDIAGSPPNSRYVFGVVCDGYPSLEEGMEENNVVGRDWVVTHISLPRELCYCFFLIHACEIMKSMMSPGFFASELRHYFRHVYISHRLHFLHESPLAMNDMTGTLPAQVSHLRYLKEFHIQLNPGITGPIPSEYGNFRNLRTMNLGYNSLNGTIPNALSQLEKLEELLLEVC